MTIPSVEAIQQILDALFPGLMGVRLLTLEPERVVAAAMAPARTRRTRRNSKASM